MKQFQCVYFFRFRVHYSALFIVTLIIVLYCTAFCFCAFMLYFRHSKIKIKMYNMYVIMFVYEIERHSDVNHC